MADRLRILLVTRSYPSANNLYQYPFVHRRVLAYLAAGHEVAVFRPADGVGGRFIYEGVQWRSGPGSELQELAREWHPHCVAVHGLSETMWPVLEPLSEQFPICAWLHGSEIPSFARSKAHALHDPALRAAALQQVEQRALFWRELLARQVKGLRLVFVSNASVEMMREDVGHRLEAGSFRVMPNPIDTALFRYEPKSAEQRFSILSIRPYDSTTYGNDLAVRAIQHLSERTDFSMFRFRLIGDGPLFEETLRPLDQLDNVTIDRRFLTQDEIAAEHRRHGVFLVPTRLDTQGVSRDEAMASGLVPVTNAIAAVQEFTDPGCAALVPPDDWAGMAAAITDMAQAPDLFLRRSAAAAARVRDHVAAPQVIGEELDLLGRSAN